MKAVVHARAQPQRDEHAVAKRLDVLRIAEQIGRRVRKALGLEHLDAGQRAAGADDGVARAGEHVRRAVDRPRAGAQRAREALAHAPEGALRGGVQLQVAEQAPHRDRRTADQRMLDAAEPAHEAGERDAGDAVGQQEVQILLHQQRIAQTLEPGRARRWGECGLLFHEGVNKCG